MYGLVPCSVPFGRAYAVMVPAAPAGFVTETMLAAPRSVST